MARSGATTDTVGRQKNITVFVRDNRRRCYFEGGAAGTLAALAGRGADELAGVGIDVISLEAIIPRQLKPAEQFGQQSRTVEAADARNIGVRRGSVQCGHGEWRQGIARANDAG